MVHGDLNWSNSTLLNGYTTKKPNMLIYLLEPRNQMRSWWAKLIRFHPFMCTVLHWHHPEAAWPFISKVGAVVLPVLHRCIPKNPKVMFYQSCVTECVHCDLINWSNSILLYVWPYNDITKKPTDHIFQKSGHQGLASSAFFYLYGTTMTSQRSPMTIYLNSRGSSVLPDLHDINQKILNWCFIRAA